MTRTEILTAIKPYFTIDELVCDHVLAKWKEGAWNFLDTDYLHALLVIRRDILKLPMWCNTSTRHQRGLRCNRCQMVRSKNTPYLSAHLLGKGGDFNIVGMSAAVAREKIKANAALLPCQVRIEAFDENGNPPSWLHFDVRPDDSKPDMKVVEFHA